jgi:hypothetical protein
VKTFACVLAAASFALGHVALADEFQKVKCGADVPNAMIGQRSQNERVVVTEKKHEALGLKHLGADEISDGLSSINWLICGAEYNTLVDRRGFVGDVIPVPPHSRQSPAFSGICQVKGKDLPDIIFAILDGAKAKARMPAVAAWKIDQKSAKFIKAPTEGLLCPRSGIYTVDGGL